MHRVNNFDFLRLLLSSFVIITHSYSLAGKSECDWLCQISNNQVLLSNIAVKGFFILSGYLIFQSLIRSTGLLDFFWKRSLRLFPLFLCVLILTVFLAPFVYEGTEPYWSNRSVWTYIPNNMLLYRTQFNISGVFEHNPYKVAINGSLWTIRYEFTMYCLLALLIPIRANKRLVSVGLITMLGLLLAGDCISKYKIWKSSLIIFNQPFLELGVFFISGALLANFKIERFRYNKFLLIVVSLMLALSLYIEMYNSFRYLLLPPLIILFGNSVTPVICNIGKRIGDISYGIYVYGFPVQQTLVYFFKPNHLFLMFYSLVISSIIAYISWHLLEKRVLKLKRVNVVSL